jgi:hypothetical protein
VVARTLSRRRRVAMFLSEGTREDVEMGMKPR